MVDGNIRLSRHVGDLDDNGHDTYAGFAPVVTYAECNSPVATHATPGTFTLQPFDTFYDKDYGTIGSLPAALGLTYSAGTFTATEDGVWALNVGADLTAAPGSTGRLQLVTPNYGYAQTHWLAASGNQPVWVAAITVAVRSGDTFKVQQFSPSGSGIVLVAGYLALDIFRIAGRLA